MDLPAIISSTDIPKILSADGLAAIICPFESVKSAPCVIDSNRFRNRSSLSRKASSVRMWSEMSMKIVTNRRSFARYTMPAYQRCSGRENNSKLSSPPCRAISPYRWIQFAGSFYSQKGNEGGHALE